MAGSSSGIGGTRQNVLVAAMETFTLVVKRHGHVGLLPKVSLVFLDVTCDIMKWLVFLDVTCDVLKWLVFLDVTCV